MAEKRRWKKIELYYSFDRLATQKLSYVYQILVPKERAGRAKGSPDFALIGGGGGENSSDLRSSVLRTPERRANDPESDRGPS